MPVAYETLVRVVDPYAVKRFGMRWAPSCFVYHYNRAAVSITTHGKYARKDARVVRRILRRAARCPAT